MKTTTKILAATAALLAAGGAAAWCAELKQEVGVSLQQGVVVTPGAPAASAKYEEYSIKRNGLSLDRYKLEFEDEGYGMSCDGSKLNYDDRQLDCEGGRPGLFTYRAGWNQIVHNYSYQSRTIYNNNGGARNVLTLPNSLKADNEGTPANYVGNMRSFANSAPFKPLSTREDIGSLGLHFRTAGNLTIDIDGAQRRRTGNMLTATSFGFSNAIENAEPIDWTTNEFGFAVGWAAPKFQTGFKYNLSDFENHFASLRFDNPKRLTDRYTSNGGYSPGDQSAHGEMALSPSNKSHSFVFNMGGELPFWHSHASAEAGYSIHEADTDLLPFTANTAINPTSVVAAGGTGTTAPFDASDRASLPYRRHHARFNVYTQAYKLTSRPTHKLRTMLEYRSWIEENKSDHFLVRGISVMDSIWRDGQGGTLAKTFEPDRAELRKDRVEAKVDYDFTERWAGVLSYGQEYEKKTREVDKGREHQINVATTYRMSPRLYTNLSYLLAMRRMNGFDNQTYRQVNGVYAELPGLARFDVADRNRNQGRLQVNYNTEGGTTFGFNTLVRYDNYRPGKMDLTGGVGTNDSTMYGLQEERNYTAGFDVDVPFAESFDADVYYEYDYGRRIIKSNRTNAAPPATQNSAEDWTNKTAETSNVFGVALNWLPLKQLRTKLAYDLVSSVLHVDSIQNGGNPVVLAYASWPATKRMQHTVTASGAYALTKALDITARYSFAKLDVTDFAFDNIPMFLNDGSMTTMGASLRGYHAHLAALGVNYKF